MRLCVARASPGTTIISSTSPNFRDSEEITYISSDMTKDWVKIVKHNKEVNKKLWD